MPTQLSQHLIEVLLPIPPVATVVAGDFNLPVIDQGSFLDDPDRGYSLVTADAISDFKSLLASDLTSSGTTLGNIDTMVDAVLSIPTTGSGYRVGPWGAYRNNDGYLTQSGDQSLLTMLSGAFPAGAGNPRSVVETLQDLSTAMAGVTPTIPGPTDDVVADPTDPTTWFTDNRIVHGVWWKLLKQYCHLTAGPCQYGAPQPATITAKYVASFETDLHPRLRDINPGAMPVVWTDDGHLYLCCAVPLQVGTIRYVCELQLWNNTGTSSTALTSGDVDQFLGDQYLAKTGTTNWLLRQDTVKFEDVAGLVYRAVDLSLYPDIPSNRSGHTVLGGNYGADFGYFWVYQTGANQLYKYSLDTLQVIPLSDASSQVLGGSISPPATMVGSGLTARWEYTLDTTAQAVWGDYFTATAYQHLSNTTNDTIDLTSSGFTLTPFFTLALPYSLGEVLSSGFPNLNWKYSFTNGFTAFMVNNRVAGIETPVGDYREPNTPVADGPYPFHYPINQPTATAGVDVVTTAAAKVEAGNPLWGMWPGRQYGNLKTVLMDDAANTSTADSPMDVFVSSSTSHDLTVTAAPYKAYDLNKSDDEAGYTSFTWPTVPIPPATTPGSGETFTFNNFQWQYRQNLSVAAQIPLAEITAVRTITDDPMSPGTPHLFTSYEIAAQAFLVNGTIQATPPASPVRTSNFNNTTTFSVTNEDGAGNPLTPPTITQIPYCELVNCALHLGGHYIYTDTLGNNSIVTGTSMPVTFDVQVVVYDYKLNTETVLHTFSHSVTFDPAATSSQLLTLFGDSVTNLVTADSFLSLPTEYGVYVRIANFAWDRSLYPAHPAITIPNEGSGYTLYFTLTLVRTTGTWQYIILNNKVDVDGAFSWFGTMPRSFTGTVWSGLSLPGGLTISSSTGGISGHLSTVGPYNLQFQAAHVEATTTGNHPVLIVDAFSPTFAYETSGLQVGRESCIRINWLSNSGSWARNPDEITVESLPPGMTLDARTGIIWGVPTRAGSWSIQLRGHWEGYRFGSNLVTGVGGGEQVQGYITPFVVTVDDDSTFQDKLFVTSPVGATAYAGQPFRYEVTTIGTPTSYLVSGLPSGLSFSSATRLITGTWTPSAGDLEQYANVSIQVSNASLTHTVTLRLRLVNVLTCPTLYVTGLDGSGGPGPSILWRMTTEQPVAGRVQWSATGLPTGLSIDPDSGIIHGVPTASGTTNPTITVTGPDAVARSQAIQIQIHTALEGRINQPSGWGEIVLSGLSGTVSYTPTLVRPSPWISGLQVVLPFPVEYSGASVAPNATGTCSVTDATGTTTSVTFRNLSTSTITTNTPTGGKYFILGLVDYTAQNNSSLSPLPDFQPTYYLITENDIATLANNNDLPTVHFTCWNTMDTSTYFTTISDWITNWPRVGLFHGTVLTPASSDAIQRIWFDQDPRRQNPGAIKHLNYYADQTRPRTW